MLPIYFVTEHKMYPIKNTVFDICKKIEIFLSQLLSMLIIIEWCFCYFEFITVLIVGINEEWEKCNQYTKQTTCIWNNFVNFASFSLKYFLFIRHQNIYLSEYLFMFRIDLYLFIVNIYNFFINKISLKCLNLWEWKQSNISLDRISS